jgi:50S ribosomal protein L16 3-hydroxylase
MLINHAFFHEYWQKKPLLMRQAATLPARKPCKKNLFSLAGEENIETRLVLEHGERPWEVHFGPFSSADLESLPDSGWTLLFQDMDKHLPEVAALFREFEGMPRWRIDDIMISFAVDKGSVGPHTDEYDVFLIQAEGKRRWQINADPHADNSLVAGLDMKILQYFEPTEEWLLEPGDVLYLPPGVAHWGVAEGECITWSVGFRAPSATELFTHWADEKLHSIDSVRYSDPDLQLQSHAGEIQPQAVEKLRTMLLSALEQETDDFAEWFGRYITEPKENLQPLPHEPFAGMREGFAGGSRLNRHPASDILFTQEQGRLYLFCGGHSYRLPERCLPFAILLSGRDSWTADELHEWLDDEAAGAVLRDLHEQGYVCLA